MGRLLVLVLLIGVYVFTLLDIGRTPKGEVRFVPRTVWVLTVLLTGAIGMSAWFLLGRPGAMFPPQSGGGGGGGGLRRPDQPRGPRSGPLAPDDDPEFLRKLDEQKWAREMDRLRQQRSAPPSEPDDKSPDSTV